MIASLSMGLRNDRGIRVDVTDGAVPTADVRIGDHPRETLPALARRHVNDGRGRSRSLRRHPGSMRLRQAAVPTRCALFVLTLLAAPAALAEHFAWAWSVLIGLPTIDEKPWSLPGSSAVLGGSS